MSDTTPNEETVFENKWFSVAAKTLPGSAEPHYLIDTNDFVSIVARNSGGKLLLVRQFRPAVEATTLEVPSGHVERGETPEQAAGKELLEETGHVADKFELIGNLSPCIGRYRNRLWCYYAPNARPTDDKDYQPEPGVETVFYDGSIADLVREKEFLSSLSATSLLFAIVEKRLAI